MSRVTDPVFVSCETALDWWPEIGGVGYTYQAFDILHEVIDQGFNRTTITVDAIGRKVASSSPDRGNESFDYNAFGELEQYTNGQGEPSTFLFDDVGRIYERRDWSGVPEASPYESTAWEWDGGATLDVGERRLDTITYPQKDGELQRWTSRGGRRVCP